NRHPFESQHRIGFTLLTCPASLGRSFHLSLRTPQSKGRPHPGLSWSTPRNFPSAFSPKTPRQTELETRPFPALIALWFAASASHVNQTRGGTARTTFY